MKKKDSTTQKIWLGGLDRGQMALIVIMVQLRTLLVSKEQKGGGLPVEPS